MRMCDLHLCLFALLVAIAGHVQAQKAFEGRIQYAIDYIEIPEALQGMEHALPEQSLVVIKDGNMRLQQGTLLSGEQITIHREGIDSLYQLIEVLGVKMQLTLPLEEEVNKFRVIEQQEIKNIMGYEAKHVILQDAMGTVLNAWCSAKFRNPVGSELPHLRGLPLEYELVRSGIRMHLVATQVVEEPVDETYFAIPPDYVRVPKDAYDRWLR